MAEPAYVGMVCKRRGSRSRIAEDRKRESAKAHSPRMGGPVGKAWNWKGLTLMVRPHLKRIDVI
jgi:hypothetical protein